MGMLDLNVDMEDSGTSNSSVVNMEESRDEDSSALVFDILKRETEEEEDKAAGEITTRPLFPVTCGSSQWLNLSSAEGDSQSDVRILDQKKQPQIRKSRRGPRSRSSQYRGVTFYRRTGRWESHIWDCGKQVYLGGFDTAHAAARAYDRAAIKFRGVEADINFCLSDYEEDLKQTRGLSKEEFVQVLRRQNSGVPRGSSKYKGLSPHKWEARMSSFFGKKEFMTSCEPRSLKGERSVETSRAAGSFHNLDLSLGISPPANESKKCDSACDIRNRRGPMVDRTGPTLIRGQAIYGVAVRSKYDQIYSNTYPGYVQNYEKMTVYQTSPWQLQSNGTIAPVPVLSSAASSKFNSSSNIDSSDPLPFNPQLQIVHQFNHNIHHQFPMLPESEQLKDLW